MLHTKIDPAADAEIIERLTSALAEDRIVPWFQAVMDPAGVTLISAEALPRLEDPIRGIVAAGELIEPAIRHGMLDKLSERLLLKTCQAYARWRERGIAPERVTINLTGKELQVPGIVDRILAVTASAGLAPANLAVEVEETTATEDGAEVALAAISALVEAGVGMTVDDLGKGPCRAEALRALKVDTAKLDRALVSQLGLDEAATARTTELAAMCKGMGVLLIAKGVETRLQIDILSSVGCDGQQGFAIARPAPEDSFSEWLDLNAF